MSRQDSILTANPISWKGKKTLAIWSTPIISSILLRWALFLLDPYGTKIQSEETLRALCPYRYHLWHGVFTPPRFLDWDKQLKVNANQLAESKPSSFHSLKILFSTEVQPMLLQLNPPKCRLSAFMKCGSGQRSHRHHMPQTQKTHIGMTLRMSSCTLSPLGS